ncbi:MAG: AmmeMemoRadiSam system protein A [Fusobacteriaceae bacterium]|jgi:AmmeMemoRadiSam system protein A|nr:AmmeMemoRadiSam system protein A [Fusobacteriaceae bacterium]
MSVAGAIAVPHPPLILPQVGRGEEKKIQKTIDGYREAAAMVARWQPETIVLVSPHTTIYADYIHLSPGPGASGDLRQFGVRDYALRVDYDEKFVDALSVLCKDKGIPAGTMGEREPALDYATMIPLEFVNEKYRTYKLVRAGFAYLTPVEHYRFGKMIAAAAALLGRRIVFIASGDLSHKLKADGPYGFAPEGPDFDRQVTEAMAKGDFLKFLTFPDNFCEKAAECGLRAFQIMAGVLDGLAVQSKLLSYEGPFGVGYGVAAFSVTGTDPARAFDRTAAEREQKSVDEAKSGEDAYVKLARLSLETYVKTGKQAALPEGLPPEMTGKRAGAFVSIKKNGRLRGCIGTIGPVRESVAAEILRNAVSAGQEDPRFSPVEEKELPSLVYSVDVLGETEPVADKSALDVKRYGVIVTSGGRRGLLLPNLEGIDDVDTQISIARQKAGIGPSEPVTLERFEVIRHK